MPITKSSRSAAICVLSCISEALRLVGPGLVATPGQKDRVCKILLQILKNEHICQEDCDDVDDEGGASNDEDSSGNNLDPEQSEQDGLLITAAADVVACLAITIGPDFASDYTHFHPFIMKHTMPTRTSSEKSMAVGTIAEVSLGMKQGVLPFVPEFLNALSAGLMDPAADVKSNAAYGIGSKSFGV